MEAHPMFTYQKYWKTMFSVFSFKNHTGNIIFSMFLVYNFESACIPETIKNQRWYKFFLCGKHWNSEKLYNGNFDFSIFPVKIKNVY